MAIEIRFTGYINRVKEFDWGVVYDVAHNQARKDENGNWISTGKDYFQVYGPAGLKEGQRVDVVGRMKTTIFDKRDGTKGMSLEVRAESITPAAVGQPKGQPIQNPVVATWPAVKELPAENIPF